MFFAKPGVYKPCGMFNYKHLLLFILIAILIAVITKNTKIEKKEEVKKIIQRSTLIIWALEIAKIIFLIYIGEGKNINKIVPLYYCSLLLYSGLFSSFGKGIIKRAGDVFLATGGIVGGLTFLVFPTTSLPEYPMFHFISFHSFFFHGTMVYLSIIINKYKYIELKFSDILYYAGLILLICIGAYVINTKFGSNLMFISKDFPNSPVTVLYNWAGKMFTPIMIFLQMTVPFVGVYGILKLKQLIMEKIMLKKICN